MSNKVINITLLLLIVLFVSFRITTACNQMNQEKEASTIDLPVSYSGIIPCADCPGIEYRLNIEQDQFTEFRLYQDRSDEPFIEIGKWSFRDDTLYITSDDGKTVNTFLYGSNTITMLDQNNEQINGNTADMYVLSIDQESTSILNRHQEFRGKGVVFVASGNEPFWSIRINEADEVIYQTPGTEMAGTLVEETNQDQDNFWRVGFDDKEVDITSQRTPCKDTMSGFQFTEAVTLQISDSEQLTGCGRFLTISD